MGGPAGDASHGEHGGEEVRVETQPFEEEGGVELDIGLKAPAGLVFFEDFEGSFLDVHGQGVQVVFTVVVFAVEEGARRARKDVGPRISYAIHGVSETHEPFTRFEFFPKPGFGVVGIADRFEHGNDRSRRPAVQRAFERSDRSRNGGDEIGTRGNNDPRRERGRVHAVINHRIQVRRERPYAVLAGDFAVQHVQQIGHMAETGVRFHWFFTVKKAPVGRYDSRQAGHQGPGVGRVVTGRQGGRGHSNHVDDGSAFLRRAAQQIEGNTGQWAARGQVPGELF